MSPSLTGGTVLTRFWVAGVEGAAELDCGMVLNELCRFDADVESARLKFDLEPLQAIALEVLLAFRVLAPVFSFSIWYFDFSAPIINVRDQNLK